jgi:alcohol dehydrogenase (cytochrome c)
MFYATGAKRSPGESGRRILLAWDLTTAKLAWSYPQIGSGHSSGGTMTTDGGLVFFGDDAESFEAVDAGTGAPLWHFQTGQRITASPMTFLVNGNQYVAIAAGSDVFTFRL